MQLLFDIFGQTILGVIGTIGIVMIANYMFFDGLIVNCVKDAMVMFL